MLISMMLIRSHCDDVDLQAGTPLIMVPALSMASVSLERTAIASGMTVLFDQTGHKRTQ